MYADMQLNKLALSKLVSSSVQVTGRSGASSNDDAVVIQRVCLIILHLIIVIAEIYSQCNLRFRKKYNQCKRTFMKF